MKQDTRRSRLGHPLLHMHHMSHGCGPAPAVGSMGGRLDPPYWNPLIHCSAVGWGLDCQGVRSEPRFAGWDTKELTLIKIYKVLYTGKHPKEDIKFLLWSF